MTSIVASLGTRESRASDKKKSLLCDRSRVHRNRSGDQARTSAVSGTPNGSVLPRRCECDSNQVWPREIYGGSTEHLERCKPREDSEWMVPARA
jgi:hypothetical protein